MYVAKVLSNNMIVGITWKQEKKLLKNESKFILLFTMFGVPGNFLSMNLPPKSWTTWNHQMFGSMMKRRIGT